MAGGNSGMHSNVGRALLACLVVGCGGPASILPDDDLLWLVRSLTDHEPVRVPWREQHRRRRRPRSGGRVLPDAGASGESVGVAQRRIALDTHQRAQPNHQRRRAVGAARRHQGRRVVRRPHRAGCATQLRVHTGSDITCAALAFTCLNWTSAAAPTSVVVRGWSYGSSNWTELNRSASCAVARPLCCFEQ